jgi:hypothetical protein
MPSRAMRTARPSRLWPWSSCSKCWIATPICSMRSGWRSCSQTEEVLRSPRKSEKHGKSRSRFACEPESPALDSGRSQDTTIWNDMGIYKLISQARPRLRDGQETRLYDVLEELGVGPVTLDQIVKQCEYRRYAALLKTEPSVRNSVEYHLRSWTNRGIVERL